MRKTAWSFELGAWSDAPPPLCGGGTPNLHTLRSKLAASQRGFTLVETIVVVALTAVVLMALSSLIVYFYRTNAYVLEQSQAVDSARRSVAASMSDLREATYGADGSYPLSAAATSTVTFYANVDSDPAIEKVRYYLSGVTFYRGVTKAAGNPPSYAGQPETTNLVVDNVRNGTIPVFQYFDANGNELAEPVNLAKVTSVRTTVLTDVNPTRAPNVYTLTGSATLRNIRDANAQ
ncbi:MAG: prepilin-type N-terminal cleavage/methylation domain-containing protein [Patescibacteria group bacterium]|nr:prepilin-type N-terminal cleavage/methylation domain-containing protein [Patescibacteria group bacterium]MDE1965910.1 prepilin-type N-terminal cleavage/methylation domain-containing protein [Patescibacteria group bacterium]